MKDENGDMVSDEDREAVEISRGSRNREISGDFWEDADSERKALRETFGRATDESGDMALDEDREAVENREAAEIARQ